MIKYSWTVRKIGLTYRSLSGNFFSIKNNKVVQFESSLERDFVYTLEMDHNVISFLEQPFTITYRDPNNKIRRYTPDFLYNIAGLKSVVIEIKYQEDLRQNSDIYTSKFDAAKVFCEENSYEFKVLTENDIRNDYLLNCKFLYSYKSHKVDIKDPSIELLINNLKKLSFTTPRKLIEFSVKDLNKQIKLLYYVWYMIAINTINCFWNERITMDSKIWIE